MPAVLGTPAGYMYSPETGEFPRPAVQNPSPESGSDSDYRGHGISAKNEWGCP